MLLPKYIRRMWRRGGYSIDWQQRMGWGYRLPERNTDPAKCKKRIWLQAVSVGEILAIKPLLKILRADNSIEVILTTTTSTGYKIVKEHYSDLVDASGLFPTDFWWFSRAAWNRINPDLVILMEGELWPEHIHRAARKKVPVLLINARMSDRSMRQYLKFPNFTQSILSRLTAILASTQQDFERFTQLAGGGTEILSTGNIKVDVPVEPLLSESERQSLREELGLFSSESRPEKQPVIILGSSTWPGEESVLIETFKNLLDEGHSCRLLLVPRHAERRKDIQQILENQDLSWHFRSDSPTPPQPVKIYVGDTTGELKILSQIADIAFIGKSLPPIHHEGQTPIEAAGIGLPLLMGPEMSNFREIARNLVRVGAARKIEDSGQLLNEIRNLLINPEIRHTMAVNSQNWHKRSRGAVNRTVEIIKKHLN